MFKLISERAKILIIGDLMKEVKLNLDEEEIEILKKVFHTSDEIEAIKLAIHDAIKKKSYTNILELKGNVVWEGNLDDMRESNNGNRKYY